MPVLNSSPVLPEIESVPTNAEETTTSISSSLRKAALKIQSTWMKPADDSDESGSVGVDYVGLKQSAEWREFLQVATRLRHAEVPKECDERKAFFINLYNVLMVHGVVSSESDMHPVQEAQKSGGGTDFFSTTSYNVAGFELSLDDIEHGILRANRPHPSGKTAIGNDGKEPTRWFTESDQRCSLVLNDSEFDPRIHFALVCGAKGCPPIQIYEGKNVERALKLAAKAFLVSESKVVESDSDSDSRSLETTMLLKWYGADFGASAAEIVSWIREASGGKIVGLDESVVELSFRTYDWGLNTA